jgi:hypothetical protein
MPPHYGEQRQQHNPLRLKCTVHGCPRWFKNLSGRTKHFHTHHGAQAVMHPGLQHRRQPSPPAVHANNAPQMGRVSPSTPWPSHSPCPPPGNLRFSPLLDMGALSGGMLAQSSGDRDPERDLRSPSPRNSPMPQFSGSSPSMQDFQFSHRSHSHLSNQSSESTSNGFLTNISHPLINGECVLPVCVPA